jgi:SAM-dependent methyltransferase
MQSWETTRAELLGKARTLSGWVDLQWSFILADMKAVAPLARGRMLDVGCGDKPYEPFFRPFVAEYIGIEHEATFAGTNAANRRRPDFFYDGRTLPFEDGCFDTVMSVQVLEHTSEPQRLIDEMARVLHVGGTLIVNAPFSFRLHEEPHDYFRYTPHGLRAMLARSGLDIVELRGQGGLFSVLAQKINAFLAFELGRLDALSQAMGGLGHEPRAAKIPRYWALPAIVPAMLIVGAGARVFDRVFPDPTEALSFLVVARKRDPGSANAAAGA